MKDTKLHIKWKGFMIKAENPPIKLWKNLGWMFLALRTPEIIDAIGRGSAEIIKAVSTLAH